MEMKVERIPIPQLAKSALVYAQKDFQEIVNTLGVQTLEAMGLSTKDGWVVRFTEGYAERVIVPTDLSVDRFDKNGVKESVASVPEFPAAPPPPTGETNA